MKQISKVAKQFIKKQLMGNVSFESLSRYANRLGYIIKFYEPDRPDDIVKLYNLSDIAKARQALTFRNDNVKYIFINNEISPENKLHALAHELAHIILGHLDVNKNIVDYRRQDMEADAFAHALLNYKSHKSLYAIIISVVLAIVLAICGITYHMHTTRADSTMVYITPTGKKYHSENCRYVQGKDRTAVSELQAEKNYEPCKVCNPK